MGSRCRWLLSLLAGCVFLWPLLACTADLPTSEGEGFVLEGVGFSTPESVLYDPESDVYLVANINGGPGDKDGNGFVSRVSPGGKVLDLTWIDGSDEGVTLNAPKGMAVYGTSLFVADIDALRVFDRATGVPIADVVIPDAVFLNDVAVDENGNVYVTDTWGPAIHRIGPDLSRERIAEGEGLGSPNGIRVRAGRVFVATAGGETIYELGDDGAPMIVATLPAGRLDGLILLDDGAMLVSSWESGSVYRVGANGDVSALFEGISSPADIGYDTKRAYVLIPRFTEDVVEARPIAE